MAKYDPSKQYQWKLEDKIEFSGKELHKLNETMTQFVQSGLSDVPMILKLMEVYAIVQNKMAEYVEKGVITEFTES